MKWGQVFPYHISHINLNHLHNPANTRVIQLKVPGQLRHCVVGLFSVS